VLAGAIGEIEKVSHVFHPAGRFSAAPLCCDALYHGLPWEFSALPKILSARARRVLPFRANHSGVNE
jgi:hypothetical protein